MNTTRATHKMHFVTIILFFLLQSLALGENDTSALLALKSSISGSSNLLRDWNPKTKKDYCSWTGISCNPQRSVVSLNISAKTHCFKSSGIGYALNCRLNGHIPRAIEGLRYLRVLSLPFHGLVGDVPNELSNLGFLEILELEGNKLRGKLPSQFFGSLRVLNLANNGFTGGIPRGLSKCIRMDTLVLNGNSLNGSVPKWIGRLAMLRFLSLGFNQLCGKIPSSIGSGCQSLQHLWLGGNLLVGDIPSTLGNCKNLKSLLLFSNILEGSIPDTLGRLQFLEVLDVSRNSLTGYIPPQLGECKNLKALVLVNLHDFDSHADTQDMGLDSSSVKGEFNFFEGGVPESLTKLKILWAPRSNLSSPLPQFQGDCGELRILNLGQNLIPGLIPAGLAKCQKLVFLDLSSNSLGGSMPEDLHVASMVYFNVSHNSLSGTLPGHNSRSGNLPSINSNTCFKQMKRKAPINYMDLVDVDDASSLDELYVEFLLAGSLPSDSASMTIFHDFSHNGFVGSVPPALVEPKCYYSNVSYNCFLNHNNLSGIDTGFSSACRGLQSVFLNLKENQLAGNMSSILELLDCSSLVHLDVSSNKITGSLSSGIHRLSNLVHLDFSSNRLKGVIPHELGQLKRLQFLSLAWNSISGVIPVEIGSLLSLMVLDLSSNSLAGVIPEELGNLRQLRLLLLGSNRLTGQVPKSLAHLPDLTTIDVSFNNLSGTLPTFRNSTVCDNIRGNMFLAPCSQVMAMNSPTRAPFPYASQPHDKGSEGGIHLNKIEIAAITSGGVIFCAVLVVLFFMFCGKRHLARLSSIRYGGKEVVTFTDLGVQLTHESVARATGNFSIRNLIGNGGFGATYKAELIPELMVAVKRLSVGRRIQGIQQFETEIRTLGRIRHQNLVTLIGYYASETEMFLLYNYLPGGNLESFIHGNSRNNIHWSTIHKIALQVAEALNFLHNSCVPRVLHRDIKPSNILLDNSSNAYLSDFGLARILEVTETHATTDVAGTFGYVAPEYALTCRVSDKSDVYSYGVVLLEMMSGKKSLDPSFSCYGNGFNIVAWASMLVDQGREREAFLQNLWDSASHEHLVKSLHLAVKCTVEVLSARPSMRQVLLQLKQLHPCPPS